MPIAVIDFATSSTLISEMVFNEDDNKVIATAIPTIDQVLRPVVKACKASWTAFIVSTNTSFHSDIPFLLKTLSNVFSIVSKNLVNSFNAINIPPPAKPAATSPADIFSKIHLIRFSIGVQIFPTTSTNVPPIADNTSVNPCKPLTDALKRPDIPEVKLDKTPINPSILKSSFKDVKTSPIAAAVSSTNVEKAFTPSDCAKSNALSPIAVRPFLNKSTIENKPLKVLLSLSLVSELIVSPSVNFFKFSVNS